MESQIKEKQLPKGTTLQNGQYTILDVLGQGGFGITYLARHKTFGEVALKELFLNSAVTYCTRESTTRQQVIPQFDDHQFSLFKKRFEEEARTLYSLRDIKGVVKVQHIFEENGTVYFSMEYLEGTKLEDYVLAKKRPKTENIYQVILELGAVLSAVHKRKVLHCDIKPSNVIIDGNGNVSLIDFGIARSCADEITETHTTFHSPRYAPPEQKIAKSSLGPYSDVYALGATAYFAFTGKVPQSIEERTTGDYIPPQFYLPSLPDPINDAISKCLQFKVEERYQSVEGFLSALSDAGHSILAGAGKEQLIPDPIPVPGPEKRVPGEANTTIVDANAEMPPVKTTDDETKIDNAETPAVKQQPKKFPVVLLAAVIALLGIVSTYIYLQYVEKRDAIPAQQNIVPENPVVSPAKPETAVPATLAIDTPKVEKSIIGKWATADKRLLLSLDQSHLVALNEFGGTWHLHSVWSDSCQIKIETTDLLNKKNIVVNKGSSFTVKIFHINDPKSLSMVFVDKNGKVYTNDKRPVFSRLSATPN